MHAAVLIKEERMDLRGNVGNMGIEEGKQKGIDHVWGSQTLKKTLKINKNWHPQKNEEFAKCSRLFPILYS